MIVDNTYHELCALVGDISRAPRVSLSRSNVVAGRIEIFGRSYGSANISPLEHAIPVVGQTTPIFLVRNVTTHPAFSSHIIRQSYPNLNALACYWICNFEGMDYVLSIWNPQSDFFDSESKSNMMDHILLIFRQLIQSSSSDVMSFNEAGSSFVGFENQNSKASETTVRFLLETLIKKPRLLVRNGSPYLALRQWRKQIKEYQVQAFFALKANDEVELLEPIATEITAMVKQTWGYAFKHLVPIPGGSSGKSNSLSVKLGRLVAARLGIEFCEILIGSGVSIGRSHPKKSQKLQPYNLRRIPTGNVLILDDVATSGKHVELATAALRPHVEYCTSVVWVAD
jgi:hypothetical protein